MIDLTWLLDAIQLRNPIQTASKSSKPWFIDARDHEPVLFMAMIHEAETHFHALTGAWAIWCLTVEEGDPIVWRSLPAIIERLNEDNSRVWRVEAQYGIGVEE